MNNNFDILSFNEFEEDSFEEIISEDMKKDCINEFIQENNLDIQNIYDRIKLLKNFKNEAIEYFFNKNYINYSIKNFLEHFISKHKDIDKLLNSKSNEVEKNRFLNIINLPFTCKQININFENLSNYENKFEKLMKGDLFKKIFLKIIHKILIFKRFTTKTNPSNNVFLFVGEPGCGKSYFPKVLAEIIELPFININLAHGDILTLKGGNSGWRKADIGFFTKEFIKKKYKNPIILLDEIDKGGKTNDVDVKDIVSNIIDPDQGFMDLFLEVEIDLSNCIFFLTANDIKELPPYLIDRCEIYYVPSPSIIEKTDIICDYILPKFLEENSFNFSFSFDKNEIFEILKKTNMGLRMARKFVEEVVIYFLINHRDKIDNKKNRKILNISKLVEIEKFKNFENKYNKIISFI